MIWGVHTYAHREGALQSQVTLLQYLDQAIIVCVVGGMHKRLTDITGVFAQRLKLTWHL